MQTKSSVRRSVVQLGFVVVTLFAAVAAESFPLGHELILDAQPMKGSKRVPVIDVDDNGTATIDLWCATVKAQLVIAGDTITIVTGAKPEGECPPERAKGDDEMLQALSQVTTWRFDGNRIVLIGPTMLQFRIPTN